MTLLHALLRQTRRPLAPLAALGVALALLAACGGGTSQVSAFHPSRLLVLGDETSLIVDDGNADGYKYSINDRTATTGKCNAQPVFIQSVASLYGFAFAACNPEGLLPRGTILAIAGAQVDDPVNGLGQQVADVPGGLLGSDLVTVMIGANDVIALYQSVNNGTMTEDQAIAEAKRRGGVAAAQVNQILGTGARALVFTIPDMGLTPFAISENAVSPGASALMSTLSSQYNAYLRTGIDASIYDGHNYGLVLIDDIVSAMASTPPSYLASPADVVDAACDINQAVLPYCLTTTLVSGANGNVNSYLWADDRHLGPAAHARIGAQAQTRLVNNPF